jgi:hypothetical protein
MTSNDKQTLLIAQGCIAEASSAAETDYSNDRDDTEWQPCQTELD